MLLNKEIVINAVEGVLLIQHPVLWEASGQPTEKHIQAIKSVQENFGDFYQIVMAELQNSPCVNNLFGHLIHHRLLQEKPLASPILQSLFPNGFEELENRLNRILYIPNIKTVSASARLPKSPSKGEETDEIIRDVWTEFFVADFLVATLMPAYIEKIVRGKSEPAVEFYIQQDNEEWILEVARLRKKDFIGETMPWGSRDCLKPENVAVIHSVLHSKLSDKNKQIQKFIGYEKRDFDKRIVAIKTSQEEYQDCSQVIAGEAQRLLSEKKYPEITHLLLLYDIEKYEFIENIQAR